MSGMDAAEDSRTMRTILFASFLFLALLACGSPAKADYFVWTDPQTGLTLSFPDTWRRLNDQQPNDLITLIAPSENGRVVCRVRADSDRRFLIYPPRYDADIQKVAYSKPFWDDYLLLYDNVKVEAFSDMTGVGRGTGSRITATYTDPSNPKAPRKGIFFVALDYGTVYLAECSSPVSGWMLWRPLFLSVIGSIDFRKSHHELATGDYRYFMQNGGNFEDPNAVSTSRF